MECDSRSNELYKSHYHGGGPRKMVDQYDEKRLSKNLSNH